MKRTILFFATLTTFMACKEQTDKPITSNKLLWAETVQTILPLEKDSLWNAADWDAAYKYDKEKIFNSITKAVLAGKLKAYLDYPGTALTIPQFKKVLVQWDSTVECEDPNNPGVLIPCPVKTEQSAETMTQLRFNEKIELDTINFTLTKKVTSIIFFCRKYTDQGFLLGYRKLFEVKLNDTEEPRKEK